MKNDVKNNQTTTLGFTLYVLFLLLILPIITGILLIFLK